MDRSITESIRQESAPESTLFALSPVVAQPDSFIVGRRLSTLTQETSMKLPLAALTVTLALAPAGRPASHLP